MQDAARAVVQSLMAVPDNVPEIVRTLELRFGRADLVMALISRAQRLPTIAEGDFHGLITLAGELKKCHIKHDNAQYHNSFT